MRRTRILFLLQVLGLWIAAWSVSMAQSSVVQQLRILQPTNGNTFVFLPGANTVQQNVTLPAALPTTTGQVLNVSSVSAPNVTLTWASPSNSGAPLETRQTADAVTNTTAWFQSSLSVAPAASKTYAITGIIRIQTAAAADDPKVRFTVPAGATIAVTIAATRSGGPAVNSTDATATITLDNDTATMQTYVISGTLTMSTTTGNVVLEYQRTGTSNVTFGTGSSLLYSAVN